jgi:sugar phosphate isomerase/epimerase
MTIKPRIARPLGTMIVYGYAEKDVATDLDLALRIGATCVEILPLWRTYPDPKPLKRLVSDHGMTIHSAHGCWGSQAIAARRVDLGSLEPTVRQESVDDIRRCLDWIAEAGGRHLVIHPGGLSEPAESLARRSALIDSLNQLAGDAHATGVTLCVENMPPGVHPGSQMAEIAMLVAEVGRVEIGLALDTGHAHLVASAHEETLAAGRALVTTHVHDNRGKKDVHLPPGFGEIQWGDWVDALDEIDYSGPVMLECIRYIRDHPEILTPEFLRLLRAIAGIA